MPVNADLAGYRYGSASSGHAHDYLLPSVKGELASFFATRRSLSDADANPRVFDLGCGNGSVANRLSAIGFEVCGVDPSVEGIAQAKAGGLLGPHVSSAEAHIK